MARIDEDFFKVPEGKQAVRVEDILEEDETVLVRLKPSKRACIWESVLRMLPIVIIWLAFDVGFITMLFVFDMPTFIKIFVGIFMLFHLMPVWIWISGIIRTVAGIKNLEYYFTEKRIICKSGVVGIDFKTFYYTNVYGLNCKVGLLEKRFKVGDIYVAAAQQTMILNNIPNPYFYLSKLQEITLDIKTDIFYPNDLRPEENHGYNTRYNG